MEGSNFENSYIKFAEKVLSCVNSVWLTPTQIYDSYRLKFEEKSFDNGLFGDLQITLENLYDEGVIIQDDCPKLGARYMLSNLSNKIIS